MNNNQLIGQYTMRLVGGVNQIDYLTISPSVSYEDALFPPPTSYMHSSETTHHR